MGVPSHVTHAVHLLTTLAHPGVVRSDQAWDMDLAILGAQLPDMFYHNRRRRPSGLHLGVVIHKEGVGRLAGALLCAPGFPDRSRRSLVAGLVCHAVLDRAIHPWINYVTADSPDRADHVMLEQIIDECLGRRSGAAELGQRIAGSARAVTESAVTADALLQAVAAALRQTYPRAGNDERLLERCRNALLDARDFWSWRAGRSPGRPIPAAACSIALNTSGKDWKSPWDSSVSRNDSVEDLMTKATETAAEIVALTTAEPGGIAARLGNANLSDGQRDGPPLPRVSSGPEIAAELRRSLAG